MRSLRLRDVPRRIAGRVMIPKKISIRLSQLPLALPAVPGERGRHSSPVPATNGWQRRMLGAFESIWQDKISDYSMGPSDRLVLNLDELRKVYVAWPYPRA